MLAGLAIAPDRPWAFALAVGLGVVAVYPWLVYPVLLRAVGARVRPPVAVDPVEWPSITVLVAARNEEAHIAERVANVLAQDYPRDRLAMVCVSDASTDATDERFVEASRALGERAVLVRQPAQAGKPAALAAGWRAIQSTVRSDLVVLTDANSHFEPETLRALARPFVDPRVGAVAGEKRIRVPEGAATHDAGEGFYWRFEARLRADEGRLGLCQGADGACWAIRRDLWDGSGPRGRFADDLWGPLQVLRQGWQVVAASEAVGSEEAAPNSGAEVQRKRRTYFGLLLLLPHLGWLAAPRHWGALWCFVSHKAVRLLTPWALLGHAALLALAGGVWLAVAGFEVLAAGVLMLLAMSGVGASGPFRSLGRAGYFLVALVGPVLAWWDAARALVRRDPGDAAHRPTSRSVPPR